MGWCYDAWSLEKSWSVKIINVKLWKKAQTLNWISCHVFLLVLLVKSVLTTESPSPHQIQCNEVSVDNEVEKTCGSAVGGWWLLVAAAGCKWIMRLPIVIVLCAEQQYSCSSRSYRCQGIYWEWISVNKYIYCPEMTLVQCVLALVTAAASWWAETAGEAEEEPDFVYDFWGEITSPLPPVSTHD